MMRQKPGDSEVQKRVRRGGGSLIEVYAYACKACIEIIRLYVSHLICAGVLSDVERRADVIIKACERSVRAAENGMERAENRLERSAERVQKSSET